MKLKINSKLIVVTLLFILLIPIFSSCTPARISTTDSEILKQEIAKQKSYYAGFWRSCVENFIAYSGDNIKTITEYCEKRLKQSVDNDYYNGEQDGTFIKFPSLEKDFTNIDEYEFYRGGWNECYMDVVTMSDLKDQQLLDFCSNVLANAKTKDWANKIDTNFPHQPIIILATKEPQG